MKSSSRSRQWFGRSFVWIVIYVIALLAVFGFYCADIFIFKNPPTKNLAKSFAVALVLTFSLCGIIWRQRSVYVVVERIYAEKIGNAFEKDASSKRKLLSALWDFYNEAYADCVKKLSELQGKASTVQERQVIRYFTAMSLKKTGDAAGAAELYRNILEENPTYAPALSNLSVICYEMGDYVKTVEYAQRALEYTEKNPYACHNLASAYLQLYDLENAKTYAKKALELKGDLYQAAALLAVVCAAKDETWQAKKYRDMAVSSGQDPEVLKQAVINYREQYERHVSGEEEKS